MDNLKDILKQVDAINAAHEQMARLSESAASRIADEFARMDEPRRRLIESVSEQLKATQRAVDSLPKFPKLPDFEALMPMPKQDLSSLDRVPEPRMSPAAEALTAINERFEAERAEKENQRHVVKMFVTLLDGSRLAMDEMSTDGEHLVRVRGIDAATKEERTVTVGAQTLQIEFITMERKPELRLV